VVAFSTDPRDFIRQCLVEDALLGKGIKKGFFRRNKTDSLGNPRTEDDIVSGNAKMVLFGLFSLVGFAVLLYAITMLFLGKPGATEDAQFEKLQEINSVYIAAISGALALGGTLISQIWGRTRRTNRSQ
jgi:hypothetical protein